MDLLIDGLLLAATLFAAGYCWLLSMRVKSLKSLDKGLGKSIVTLTRQIELARSTLEDAKGETHATREELNELVSTAAKAAGQLRVTLSAANRAEQSLRAGVEAQRSMQAREPEPEISPEPEKPENSAKTISEIPKPVALSAITNPLRRRSKPKPRSEEELVEALTELAGGARG